jgi:hypothetical protein
LQGPQSIAKYGVSDLGDGAVKISTLGQFRVSANNSARMKGHDPYAYLKDVLTRLPIHKAGRIEELLPHRWQPSC